MVKQDERLPDDPCQQTHRTINALTSTLEVPETAQLEGFEL